MFSRLFLIFPWISLVILRKIQTLGENLAFLITPTHRKIIANIEFVGPNRENSHGKEFGGFKTYLEGVLGTLPL